MKTHDEANEIVPRCHMDDLILVICHVDREPVDTLQWDGRRRNRTRRRHPRGRRTPTCSTGLRATYANSPNVCAAG